MNLPNIRRFAAIALLLSLSRLAAAGGLSLQSGSRLWLEGDSSLHAYASTATVMAFSASLASGAASGRLEESVRAGLVRDVSVVIAVNGLKSGESKLDKNLRAALKDDKSPSITLRLTGYKVMPSTDAGVARIEAAGFLSIAGQENPVELTADATFSEGSLRITGRHPLLMSKFGVKPPELMFGMIKVRDPVVVHFDLMLAKPENPSAP